MKVGGKGKDNAAQEVTRGVGAGIDRIAAEVGTHEPTNGTRGLMGKTCRLFNG